MVPPVPWEDTDVSGSEGSNKHVLLDGVVILVASEYLAGKTAE